MEKAMAKIETTLDVLVKRIATGPTSLIRYPSTFGYAATSFRPSYFCLAFCTPATFYYSSYNLPPPSAILPSPSIPPATFPSSAMPSAPQPLGLSTLLPNFFRNYR